MPAGPSNDKYGCGDTCIPSGGVCCYTHYEYEACTATQSCVPDYDAGDNACCALSTRRL